MKNKLKRLKIISYILRVINKKYNHCKICGLPWNHCNPRVLKMYTHYILGVCQYCWNNSPIDVIEDFYKKEYHTERHQMMKNAFKLYYTEDELLDTVRHEYNKSDRTYRYEKISRIKNQIKKSNG